MTTGDSGIGRGIGHGVANSSSDEDANPFAGIVGIKGEGGAAVPISLLAPNIQTDDPF